MTRCTRQKTNEQDRNAGSNTLVFIWWDGEKQDSNEPHRNQLLLGKRKRTKRKQKKRKGKERKVHRTHGVVYWKLNVTCCCYLKRPAAHRNSRGKPCFLEHSVFPTLEVQEDMEKQHVIMKSQWDCELPHTSLSSARKSGTTLNQF